MCIGDMYDIVCVCRGDMCEDTELPQIHSYDHMINHPSILINSHYDENIRQIFNLRCVTYCLTTCVTGYV